MYQALYRKWRPRTFDDVVGQDHITQTLKRQVETGRLSHAYLFIGTRGTGKTTCAKILAKAVNCEHPVNGSPCNECAACRGIDSGAVMDVVELDAASYNKVEDVRSLQGEAIFSPASVKKRVYIIDEVHMLSNSAFNALLKLLEEPPEHLMFILCTTELRKVLPTIVSRCQRHSFKRLSPEDISGRLRYVAAQEGIPLTDGAADMLARLAEGGMRDGLSLLDQCSGAQTLDEEAVLSAMGLAGSRRTAELLDAVCAHDAALALKRFDTLWNDGKDPAAVLDELAALMRDILLTKVAPNGCAELLSGVHTTASLQRFSKKFTAEELAAAMDAIRAADLGGASPRRTAELCLIGLCTPAVGDSLPRLRARVAALEQALANGIPAAISAPVPAPEPEPAPIPEPAPEPVPARISREEIFSMLDPEPAPVRAQPEPEDDEPDDEPQADPETPPQPAAPPEDFWKSLLKRLPGKLDIGTCALLMDPQVTGQLSGGALTVTLGSNPFILGMLETPANRDVIQQEAAALAGHAVQLRFTQEGAAAAQPDLGKLDSLTKFSNFKFE